MHPEFDSQDQATLDARQATWNSRKGPRIGDIVEMPDGRVMRFSHDWGDTIQISKGGSYYLGNGLVSMSGGLEPAIDKSRLEYTGRKTPVRFWFFHHDHAQAHNGVDLMIPCRVYRACAI